MTPIAWYDPTNGAVSKDKNSIMFTALGQVVPLYPQRQWVGLTDEDKNQVAWSCGAMSADWIEFAEAIETKLKEKNT